VDKIKKLLASGMIKNKVRTVLQIYFRCIHFKILDDAKGGAVFVKRDGAMAGGPPFRRAGVGGGYTYYNFLNNTLKFQNHLRNLFINHKVFPKIISPQNG